MKIAVGVLLLLILGWGTTEVISHLTHNNSGAPQSCPIK